MNPDPTERLRWNKREIPQTWLRRNARFTNASRLIYVWPLILGATLPGQNLYDPEGWLTGFKRIAYVGVIVLLQVSGFAFGWFITEGIARKVIAAIFILTMSFWLGRNYFFSVEADWKKCAALWIVCYFPTIIIDGIAQAKKERAAWRRSRND